MRLIALELRNGAENHIPSAGGARGPVPALHGLHVGDDLRPAEYAVLRVNAL